jgi:hypothetical protein
MKYQVGHVVVVKDILFRFHPLLHLRPRHVLLLQLLLPLRLQYHLKNTFGIITGVEEHTDLYEKDSTENDNGYIWYSQVDQKEYYFYQDEVDGEVIV